MEGTLDRKIEVQRGCAPSPMPPGYELAADPHVSAAQMLGARMARGDDESQADAAQDAALAYLEQVASGTTVVRAGRIKYAIMGGMERDGKRPRSHRRRSLIRSYGEGLEQLPEWCL